MNTDRIAVESPEEKELLDAIPSCACAKDIKIKELEGLLNLAMSLGFFEATHDSGATHKQLCSMVKNYMERK